MTNLATMDRIAEKLDKIRKFHLLTPQMTASLSSVDERLYRAGFQGANEVGLFKP